MLRKRWGACHPRFPLQLPMRRRGAGASRDHVSAGNAVPACVTPGRLMDFLKMRNPELDPRYDGIATQYMRFGEQLGVRWDFAFYQMIIETGALTYWTVTARAT